MIEALNCINCIIIGIGMIWAEDKKNNGYFKFFVVISVVIFGIALFVGYSGSREVGEPYLYKRNVDKILVDVKSQIEEDQINPSTKSAQNIKDQSFCLIVMWRSESHKKAIKSSIQKLKYANLKVAEGNLIPIEKGYEEYKKIIDKTCQADDIILFVSNELESSSLEYLNIEYQNQKIGTLYTYQDGIVEPISFTRSLYGMMQSEEQFKINKRYLDSNYWTTQREAQSLALLQLSAHKMKKVEKSRIFKEPGNLSFLWVSFRSENLYYWNPYHGVQSETDS